jgi:hypothetical protein
MSRKPSKSWLQSLLNRQKLDRVSQDSFRPQPDHLRVDEQAIDEIIVDDLHEISTRVTPRSITLEADRAAKIEAYRLEAQQLEAQQLEAQQQAKEQVQRLETQRLERLRQRQTESFSRSYRPKNTSPTSIDTASLDSLENNFNVEFREDSATPELTPELSKSELRAQKRQRRDRRRQAIRRARRGMSFKQRIINAIKQVIQSLFKGILWLLTAILKLIGKFARAIAQALLTLCQRIYRIVAPIVKRHRWTFILGSIITIALGTAGGAVWWLTKTPPAVQCDKIATWSTDSERLDCAQIAADTGNPEKILNSIALVEDWEMGHPMYKRAQRSLQQWTEQLLIVARDKLEKQDLDGAIAIAKKIPKTSPLYNDVQQEMAGWLEARNIGQKLYEKVQAALKKQAWDDAGVALAKLANVNDPTWQKRLIELRKQLETEKLAGVTLKQAREFAKSHSPEQWGSAIALTDPINRKTFVWETAQKDIAQWRGKVFDLAIAQLLKQKQPERALALVKTIPANIDLSDEQRQFVHLAQASAIASNRENTPILQQLGRLAMASQLLGQIPEGSRFREQAMALLPQLEGHSEDVVQIEVARSIARLGPLPFVQEAIAQAEQVSSKRPRRVQAQTLIAQWKKESQRLEDAPLLAQAEQFSKVGGIAGLWQAAGLMDRVSKGRSLFNEAQKRKGQWIAQAETLEDQPILSQARSQANSGNLSQAIQTARRIGSGRALYGEAQRDIYGWSDQIQAIADRDIMDRATALAAKGNLSQAIDTASGVSSSAVIGEARSAISQWSAERESIRRSQAPPEPAPIEPGRQNIDPIAPTEPEPAPPTAEPPSPAAATPAPAPEPLPPGPSRPESDPVPPPTSGQ